MCQSYTQAHKLTHTLQFSLSHLWQQIEIYLGCWIQIKVLICYASARVYVAAGWRASTVCSGPCIPERNDSYAGVFHVPHCTRQINFSTHARTRTHIFTHKNFHTVAQRYICRWMSDTMAWNTDCGGIISSVIIWSEGLLKVTDKACKSQIEF